jgi:hypothetical protein
MFPDLCGRRLSIAVFAACVALSSSCYFRSRAKPIKGPDGTPHYFIECKKSQEHCLVEAADKCPRGYNVVDSSGRTNGSAVYKDAMGASVVHSYRGTMLIKCR